MPLTKRVPKGAKRVIAHIRDLVRKPSELPKSAVLTGILLHWMYKAINTCPLGLLPGAVGRPDRTDNLGPKSRHLGNREIEIFFRWWDTQTDPKAAVRAVWGRS